MSLPAKLYKTTIVIWSKHNPVHFNNDLEELVGDAAVGLSSYCSDQSTVEVTNQADYPDTEYFDVDEDTEE